MVASSSRRPVLALLVTCLLLAIACTDPPEKEMHQAQGAIEAARAAGAAEYASEEFQAAEAALKRSNDAVRDRDYRQALNYALDASERAQASAKAAAEARAVARGDAERLLGAADEALQRARTAAEAAAEAKVPATALAGATKALSEADSLVSNARAFIQAAEYTKARAVLADLPERLSNVASEIDAAVQARHVKRPTRRGGR